MARLSELLSKPAGTVAPVKAGGSAVDQLLARKKSTATPTNTPTRGSAVDQLLKRVRTTQPQPQNEAPSEPQQKQGQDLFNAPQGGGLTGFLSRAGAKVGNIANKVLGRPSVQKPVGAMVESAQNTFNDAVTRFENASDTLGKGHTTSERIGKIGEMAMGVVNVMLTPATAGFAYLGEIPELKAPIEGLNVTLGTVDKYTKSIVNHILDTAPIPKSAKENLKPLAGEIASLASQIYLFKKTGELPKAIEGKVNGPVDYLNNARIRSAILEDQVKTRPSIGKEAGKPVERPVAPRISQEATKTTEPKPTISGAASKPEEAPIKKPEPAPVTPKPGVPTDVPLKSLTPDLKAHEGTQLHYDAEVIRRKAVAETQPSLNRIGHEVAGTVDGGFIGTPKSTKSIISKVIRKTTEGKPYTVESPKDHARGTVFVRSAADIPKVVDELGKRGFTGEETLQTPLNEYGYRGINLTRKFANGTQAEIQVHTPESWKIKIEKSDKTYGKWRDKPVRKMDRETYVEWRRDVRISYKLWETYWTSVGKEGRVAISESVSRLPKNASPASPLYGAQWPSRSTAGDFAPSTSTSPFMSRIKMGSGESDISFLPSKEKIAGKPTPVKPSVVKPRPVTKLEKFAQRVKKTIKGKPELEKQLNQRYKVLTNKETAAAARANIEKLGIEKMREVVKNNQRATPQSNAEAMILIKRLQEKGRFQDAIDIAQNVSELNRKQGQVIQALAMWSRLTPEGVLRFAQRVVNDANAMLRKQLKVMDLPENRKVKLTDEQAKSFTEQAKKVQTMPEGIDKTVATAKLLRDISDLVPTSIGQKISVIQTMGQLLNPKTIIRNIVGNVGFAPLEMAITPVRVMVDKLISKITGERTASFAGAGEQFKALPEEAKIGYLEAKHGIRLDDLTTQMDLPQTRTFKSGVLGFFEKGLNWALRFPDRVSYGMAFSRKAAELRSLVKSGKSKLTPEQITEIADYYGKYSTFQDVSPAAKGLSYIKKGFNFGKDFGLGDIVLKYPKTPGNLLARAIDYSPTGFLKTVFEITRPLVGKLVKRDLPFRQAEFVDSFSRALVGSTAIVGTGAVLANLGIITPQKSKDKDVTAFRANEGTGAYRINADGLWRFIRSGFNRDEAKLRPGDRLFSYDWFQPNAVMMSIGAHMASRDKSTSIANTIINSLADGVTTIAEQPLVTGIKRLFGADNPIAGVVNTALSIPSSFVPTFLSQINQYLNNTQRETYSNLWWQEMWYQAAAKVPGLANTVPPRIDIFGRESSRFQPGSNSVFNVFFNPAFLSTYSPTPMTKEIMRLYDATGEAGHVPSLVGKKIKVNGADKQLTPGEYKDYQKFMGAWTTKLFIKEMREPTWNGMSDTERADKLQGIISNVRRAGKIKLFGDKPEKVPAAIQSIANQNIPETPLITGKRETSKESEARRKNVITFMMDYAKALKTEPLKTVNAIFGPERLRKIENDAVILERQADLGALDLGDKNSAVDHIVPLGMGGTNSWKNLQILDQKEKDKKDRVEKYLIRQLQSGKIKRGEAQRRIKDWRKEYEDLLIKDALK